MQAALQGLETNTLTNAHILPDPSYKRRHTLLFVSFTLIISAVNKTMQGRVIQLIQAGHPAASAQRIAELEETLRATTQVASGIFALAKIDGAGTGPVNPGQGCPNAGGICRDQSPDR